MYVAQIRSKEWWHIRELDLYNWGLLNRLQLRQILYEICTWRLYMIYRQIQSENKINLTFSLSISSGSLKPLAAIKAQLDLNFIFCISLLPRASINVLASLRKLGKFRENILKIHDMKQPEKEHSGFMVYASRSAEAIIRSLKLPECYLSSMPLNLQNKIIFSSLLPWC